MGDEINILKGEARDWAGLADVFHAAVQEGAELYSREQRAAWSPASKAGPDWSLRMARQSVWLAEADGAPIGFMTAELNGYLDCAYILKAYQGRGVFKRLYRPLEEAQRANGIVKMWVHASLHARPAFEAVGYKVVRPETVDMGGGVWLPRFAMEKVL